MKVDYFVEIEKKIEKLKEDLEGLNYKQTALFGTIKLPVWMLFRNSYLIGGGDILLSLKEHLWTIKELLKLIIYQKERTRISASEQSGNIIFVIDWDMPGFLDMQTDIMKSFNHDSLTLITSDKSLYERLNGKFGEVFWVKEFEQSIRLTTHHFRSLCKFIKAADIIRKEKILFKLKIYLSLLRSLKQIDFYNKFLDKKRYSSIVTLNDVQSHENVITSVAKQKGLCTFTLQHGIVDINHTPVISDKIFVWGEASRKELIALNVPDEKIIVSGQPGLEHKINKLLHDRGRIRQDFFEKYSNGVVKTVVTFIAGARGGNRDRDLLECCLSLCDLDIILIVKLKPNSDRAQIEQTKKTINESLKNDNICLFIEEDLYQVLTVTDILTTFQSSVVVEAFPFSVISIVLDIFDNIDLKSRLPYYSDCQIVSGKHGLRELISRIISDQEYCLSLKNKSLGTSEKYLHNITDGDASQYIYTSIINQCNSLCSAGCFD